MKNVSSKLRIYLENELLGDVGGVDGEGVGEEKVGRGHPVEPDPLQPHRELRLAHHRLVVTDLY